MRHIGSGPDIDPVAAVGQVVEPVRSHPAVVAVHIAAAAVHIAAEAVHIAVEVVPEEHRIEGPGRTAAVGVRHSHPVAVVGLHNRLGVHQPCRPSRLWCRS